MTDHLLTEAALPWGYRIIPAADGVSAEFRRRQPSWGWGGVAFATAWCVIWDMALLASAGIAGRMNWSGWPEDPAARWLIFVPVFWVPGIAITAMTLSQMLVREVWVLRRGHVTRRYRALALSLHRNADVTAVEVVHGMWHTGRGAKETLRLVGPSHLVIDVHQEEHQSVAIPAEVLALATAVAGHLVVPMRVVETVIREPSSD